MNFIKVNLWGKEIGRLSFSSNTRLCSFTFNPELKGERPDIVPILAPLSKWERHPVVYGSDQRQYQALPPFIADSLPDSWGNKLFEQWSKRNKLSKGSVSPLLKLLFIGKRGMGALEFEPAAADLEHSREIDISALYNLSLKILDDRERISIQPDEELTLQGLLEVGTSAGGRQMKAIIAMNTQTGEIRSGQVDTLADCDYYILKFENQEVPTSEIEMAFYEMATEAGIRMEECRILDIAGTKHFLTHRFDRRNGEKIHIQTLAAINPDADSYEELVSTCRALNLSNAEVDEMFLRLVFNVMANNTDDHNKNFSFMLEEGGRWKLSPAYDQTFIFNRFGTDGEEARCLSIGGKFRDITREDIIEFARENGFRGAEKVMDKVAGVLKSFPSVAERNEIPTHWRTIIENTINRNLVKFGYPSYLAGDEILTDADGRRFSNISVKLNRRGIYEIEVSIDGKPGRRFIRKSMELFHVFDNNGFYKTSPEKRLEILTSIFKQ